MTSKLWGGRFTKDINSGVLDYTYTTDIDVRIIKYDILCSIAHNIMLMRENIIDEHSAISILNELVDIYNKSLDDNVLLNKENEDVHLCLEQIIIDKLGIDIGGKMHTARSRNDQVVTDTKMYLRNALLEIQNNLIILVETLLTQAKEETSSLAVGYTHLQPAQPITYGFWLTCYASIFIRDIERLSHAYKITNRSSLGSCALAGTSFPIDRELTADLLGFDSVQENSLDATSSRDFIIQSVSALSILMNNFSRIAEEIVLWNSFEFGLLDISDSFATGSSIMPQKKNAVVAELIKSKGGRVNGTLIQLLTMTKGVTMGYNCDLQEDKPMLWQAIDTTISTTGILTSHINNIKYSSERAENLSWKNFSTITELANYLVKKYNISFRESHKITGNLTSHLININSNLKDTETVIKFLSKLDINITRNELIDVVSPMSVINKQISMGSTGEKPVLENIKKIEHELQSLKSYNIKNQNRLLVKEKHLINIAVNTINNTL